MTFSPSRAWTSNLSVGEFACVESVGFEPLGQVMGVTVERFNTNTWGSCGLVPRAFNPPRLPRGVAGAGNSRTPWVGYPERVRALYAGRRRALVRLARECADLGGDGVVGAALRITRVPGMVQTFEYEMIGTAVRGAARKNAHRTFVSHVGGQDFAKLLESGWVPCGVAFGVAIGVRHDDYRTRHSRWSFRNQEIPGYTELMHETRAQVRSELARDVAGYGASGVITAPLVSRVWEQDCRMANKTADHCAEVTVYGTAIVPFRPEAKVGSPPLQVMRLDQEHSRVVGRRLSDDVKELG